MIKLSETTPCPTPVASLHPTPRIKPFVERICASKKRLIAVHISLSKKSLLIEKNINFDRYNDRYKIKNPINIF